MTVDFVVMNACVFFSVEVNSHFFGVPCEHKVISSRFFVKNSKYALFNSIRWSNVLRILCYAHFRMC